MRLLAVLFFGVTVAYAADRCSPPLELAEFVNALPADNGARRAAIEEQLKQTPDDVTLHRIFVDSSVYERKPIRERYQRLLDRHPDSLDYQYLQARSLVGSDTRQALRIYARILDEDPDYPWVHLSQLEIYRAEAFRDREKLAASFSIIQRVCPSSFEPYSYLNEIADDDTVERGVAKLRTLLKEANGARELRLFATLWAAEFRVHPPAEHEGERKQVAEDLKRLLPFENDPRIRATIENGAKLTGDTALAQRLGGERKPDPRSVVMDQSNGWIHARFLRLRTRFRSSNLASLFALFSLSDRFWPSLRARAEQRQKRGKPLRNRRSTRFPRAQPYSGMADFSENSLYDS
jgi:hypothetical protein